MCIRDRSMPAAAALSVFLPLLFGVGVWHFRARKSQQITIDGLLDCTVQALGLRAVLVGERFEGPIEAVAAAFRALVGGAGRRAAFGALVLPGLFHAGPCSN